MRMITGRKTTSVATIAIKELIREAPTIKNEITNAPTAKATPTA